MVFDKNQPETWPEPYKGLYRIFINISRGWWQENINQEHPWIQNQFDEAREELITWVQERL